MLWLKLKVDIGKCFRTTCNCNAFTFSNNLNSKNFFNVGDLEALKKQVITIKEGVEYRLKIVFKVRLYSDIYDIDHTFMI